MAEYDDQTVEQETLKYFDGDTLASNVWMTKYALKNNEGAFIEKTPDDMHRRIASEFARIETKFGGSRTLSEEQIYDLISNFKNLNLVKS